MIMKAKYFLMLSVSGMLLASCGKFDDKYLVNPDPRVNTTPNTSQLMTGALVRSSLRGNANAVNGDLITLGYTEATNFVQYFAQAVYPDDQLYVNTFGEWSSYYTGPLMDLQTIIDFNNNADTKGIAAANGSNNNQLATARIWRAYLFSIATDRWGNIPYSEACRTGNITPRYDAQKDIYYDLFKELREAVDQFDGGTPFKGDILFSGDAAKWKRFANSLRMILAMRLSKVDPDKGKAEFVAAMAHAGGYITTNAQNAAFPYKNDLNFRNPWNNHVINGEPFGLTSFFVGLLQGNNDPRLPVYARPSSGTSYNGIPYGLDPGSLADWTAANTYSRMGTSFYQQNSPGYFITASQVLLTRSEAALRGWITGTNAKTDYDAAVTLNFEQNGITAGAPAYLAQSAIALNASNVSESINKVALQKYIALYPNGFEAFSEWRRTGVPALTPAPFALNDSKQIPRRWGYPLNEASLNAANYRAALDLIGGTNSLDARVWWDKQ